MRGTAASTTTALMVLLLVGAQPAMADEEGTPTATEPAAAQDPQPEASTTSDRRLGDPIPLTRREPTLPALGLGVGVRYGLVGTGPTRFVDDIRFGVTDWLELRTALLPYPSSLMARVKLGQHMGPNGAFLLEGGLAHFDAGLRLVPDTKEAQVGMRFHFEAQLGYSRALPGDLSLFAAARYRYRLSLLPEDDQHVAAVEGVVSYDLLPWLSLSGGLGYAHAFGPVRERVVELVETARPGMSHFLIRDDGETQSLTVPLAMTYARTESFDVDLFCTPRVWPKLDVVFGAGIRWRLLF